MLSTTQEIFNKLTKLVFVLLGVVVLFVVLCLGLLHKNQHISSEEFLAIAGVGVLIEGVLFAIYQGVKFK
ncbi:hypothetical protein BCT61_02625 [Vibrio breoganii]|nr:hypothetical protein BCT61_02625 [Vibrio breoganii]